MANKWEWIEAITFAPEVTAGALRTGLALASYADSATGGSAFPSQTTLAERLNITDRAIRKNLASLEESGWIRKTRRGGRAGDRGFTSVYVITIPTGTGVPTGTMVPDGTEVPTGTRVPPPTGTNESPNRNFSCSQPEPQVPTNQPVKNQPVKDPPSPKASEEPRPEVTALCEKLADYIERNGSRRPTITKAWVSSARLLIDNDKREPQEVHRIIEWCQQDSFWKTNILSMPKLRDKYDQLRLKAGPALAPGPWSPEFHKSPIERLTAQYNAPVKAYQELDLEPEAEGHR